MIYLYFKPETGALTGFGSNPDVAPSLAMPADFNIEREFKSSRVVDGQLVRASALPSLSRRQLLLGLLSIGITEGDVEAEITAALSDPMEREAALIEWRAAGSYERTHPLIADIATAMSLPGEQVDALWLWAAGL